MYTYLSDKMQPNKFKFKDEKWEHNSKTIVFVLFFEIEFCHQSNLTSFKSAQNSWFLKIQIVTYPRKNSAPKRAVFKFFDTKADKIKNASKHRTMAVLKCS